jgi:hypothetical protein
MFNVFLIAINKQLRSMDEVANVSTDLNTKHFYRNAKTK